MNSTNKNIAYLHHILGADLSSIINPTERTHENIREFILANKTLFNKKIDELGPVANTKSAINAALFDRLHRIEQSLITHLGHVDVTNRDHLDKILGEVFSRTLPVCEEGLYITDSAARRILETHPPTHLITLLQCDTLAEALRLFSPRELIALTRQGEPPAWHEHYRNLLAASPRSAFENLPLKYVVIDSQSYSKELVHKDQHPKPWRVTHAKESGTIVCFTAEPESTWSVPMLQYVAVFLHYMFETTLAGAFLNTTSDRENLSPGTRVVEIITADAQSLPFFSSNMYSETVFWKSALEQFGVLFPSGDFSFFHDALSCGEYTDIDGHKSTPVSLNIIDHIWNANLLNDEHTREYFNLETDSFLYHFREAFWYDLFARIRGWDANTMREKVLRHLPVGDMPFTIHF
jgi:hypothetical protein